MSFEIEGYNELGFPLMLDREKNIRFHYHGLKPAWHTNADIFMPEGKLELRLERATSIPLTIPYDLTWHLTRVFIHQLEWPIEKRQEIIAGITDALGAMGALWHPERNRSVTVNCEKVEWR